MRKRRKFTLPLVLGIMLALVFLTNPDAAPPEIPQQSAAYIPVPPNASFGDLLHRSGR